MASPGSRKAGSQLSSLGSRTVNNTSSGLRKVPSRPHSNSLGSRKVTNSTSGPRKALSKARADLAKVSNLMANNLADHRLLVNALILAHSKPTMARRSLLLGPSSRISGLPNQAPMRALAVKVARVALVASRPRRPSKPPTSFG